MMAGLLLQQIYISMSYLIKKCFKGVTSYIGAYTATLVIPCISIYTIIYIICILIVLLKSRIV